MFCRKRESSSYSPRARLSATDNPYTYLGEILLKKEVFFQELLNNITELVTRWLPLSYDFGIIIFSNQTNMLYILKDIQQFVHAPYFAFGYNFLGEKKINEFLLEHCTENFLSLKFSSMFVQRQTTFTRLTKSKKNISLYKQLKTRW